MTTVLVDSITRERLAKLDKPVQLVDDAVRSLGMFCLAIRPPMTRR